MLSNGILLENFIPFSLSSLTINHLKWHNACSHLRMKCFGNTATGSVSQNKISVHVRISLSLYIFFTQEE